MRGLSACLLFVTVMIIIASIIVWGFVKLVVVPTEIHSKFDQTTLVDAYPVFTDSTYTIRYLGKIRTEGGYSKDIIEVTNSLTGQRTLMIQGFGVADSFRAGKTMQDD